MRKFAAKFIWLLIALLGAWAYATLALHRGEQLNSVFILLAAHSEIREMVKKVTKIILAIFLILLCIQDMKMPEIIN